MYIDTHAHLTDERYNGEADKIIGELGANRVEYIINIGYDAESSAGSVSLAQKHPDVYAAVAIHPHDSDKATEEDFKSLGRYAELPKVVAIGETGLDYHYQDCPPRETQKKVFLRHLELARSTGLPVIIHLRDAHADMYDILKANRDLLAAGGVLHCYSGSAEMAKQYLDLGLYISFAGAVTFKNARGLLEAVKTVPPDRILTETDCPYLTPEPHRGKLNYPQYVKYVAEKIAEIKQIDIGTFCGQVKLNARRLFKRITL